MIWVLLCYCFGFWVVVLFWGVVGFVLFKLRWVICLGVMICFVVLWLIVCACLFCNSVVIVPFIYICVVWVFCVVYFGLGGCMFDFFCFVWFGFCGLGCDVCYFADVFTGDWLLLIMFCVVLVVVVIDLVWLFVDYCLFVMIILLLV